MTTTMREKLCAVVEEKMNEVEMMFGWKPGDPEFIAAIVEAHGEIVDAILDTLREPDEGMIAAGFEAGRFMLTAGVIYSEYSEDPAELDGDAPAAILSAMIDHVRKG